MAANGAIWDCAVRQNPTLRAYLQAKQTVVRALTGGGRPLVNSCCETSAFVFAATGLNYSLAHRVHCFVHLNVTWLCLQLRKHAVIHNTNRKLYECPREGCSKVYLKVGYLKKKLLESENTNSIEEDRKKLLCQSTVVHVNFQPTRQLSFCRIIHLAQKTVMKSIPDSRPSLN